MKKLQMIITAGIVSIALTFPAMAEETNLPDDMPAVLYDLESGDASVEAAVREVEAAERETQKEASYTDKDLYLMAHLLAGEMQSCPDIDQLYTGSVVLNRVASPDFPNTIREVIYQKGQYQCTWDGNFDREPTDRNWANAKKLLEEGSIFKDAVFQASKKIGKYVAAHTENAWYTY